VNYVLKVMGILNVYVEARYLYVLVCSVAIIVQKLMIIVFE
jgi:hypothetical protein